MATDLTTFNFTLLSDTAEDLNDGLFNNGTVNTLLGNDTIAGAGGDIGLDNTGTINTGFFIPIPFFDRDTITGEGELFGIQNDNGTIVTGFGNDNITATSERRRGIQNDNSTIDTGKGNDNITGTGEGGIGNVNSTIDTGEGDDNITGTSETNVGIFNTSTIDTGAGKDQVTGIGPDEFSGFAGGGDINLGADNDTIRGFGNQTVFGGEGFDTAEFEFNVADSMFVPLGNNSVDIIVGGTTMSFTDVEQFIFPDQTITISWIISSIANSWKLCRIKLLELLCTS